MSDLQKLLERVKAAKGPDRELDLAIAQSLVPHVLVMRQRADDSGADPYTYWEYTGSIDAAFALVERQKPDWRWYLADSDGQSDGRPVASVYHPDSIYLTGSIPRSVGATPALALLTALLSALLSQQPEPHD